MHPDISLAKDLCLYVLQNGVWCTKMAGNWPEIAGNPIFSRNKAQTVQDGWDMHKMDEVQLASPQKKIKIKIKKVLFYYIHKIPGIQE